jgi:flagellar biosynthetic protein FliP
MCIPMCVGFAIGDLIYFWVARQFGYSKPFSELPELSVVIATFTMTAPMTAWMLYRHMARRPIAEMTATMPILAIALLALGWLGAVPKGDLVLTEHGLMMPAMLVPMFLRLTCYTGRNGDCAHRTELHIERWAARTTSKDPSMGRRGLTSRLRLR